MLEVYVFYVLFLAQAYLLSIHYPSRVYAVAKQGIVDYPPDKYPLAYGDSVDDWIRHYDRYLLFNRLVFGIGVVLLSLIYVFDVTHSVAFTTILLCFFFMLQILCNVWRVLKAKKLLDVINNKSIHIRRADIAVRRLQDFLSPAKLAAAAGVGLAALGTCTFLLSVKSGAGLIFLSVFAFVNFRAYRSAMSVLAGDFKMPMLIPKDRMMVVCLGLNAAIESAISSNLSLFVVALIVITGQTSLIPIVVCVLLTLSNVMMYRREFSVSNDDFDMTVFKGQAAAV